MTAPGGTEADRAAREHLAREARATATALLDWVGTRVDGVATARAAGVGAARPRQSAGPCTWCPVCTLVAALRGEQPELTAHLAEQASALLVVLRLLLQSHAHDHPAHEHPAHGHPADGDRAHDHPASGFPWAGDPAPTDPMAADPTAGDAAPDVAPGPGTADVPAHAVFDPEPTPVGPAPDPAARPAPDRPTGKRGPRPSPRPRPTPDATTDEPTPTPAAPTPAPPPAPTPTTQSPAAPTPGPARTVPVAAARSTRGVQRIPVRRRSRPC